MLSPLSCLALCLTLSLLLSHMLSSLSRLALSLMLSPLSCLALCLTLSLLSHATSSPYYVPVETFRHPPFFGRLTLCRTMRMTGGAALQPVSAAPLLPSLPAKPAVASLGHRDGHTQEANCRPPSGEYPPAADARAPIPSDSDTAGRVHACREFSHAGL